MAFITHSDWVSNQAYSKDDLTSLNGVNYVALKSVTSATDPSQDGTNWRVSSVTQIRDYNGLVESVRLQLNVSSNEEINNSIPLFIQLAEESFKMRLRPPVSRKTVSLTVDSEGRISAPSNIVEVINIRVPGDSGRSSIEILNANYEEFQELKQMKGAYSFESGLFWFDSKYFHIAPTLVAGTTVELVYYSTITKLGTTVYITNGVSNGNLALNSAGQTSAEWVAAGGSNTAENFVQDTQVVENNWYLSAAPQLLLYGALLRAKAFLKDDPRLKIWQEMYVAAELEVQDFIARFEESQHHTMQIDSGYLK